MAFWTLKIKSSGQCCRIPVGAPLTYEEVEKAIGVAFPGMGPGCARYVDDEGDRCILCKASFTDFLEVSGVVLPDPEAVVVETTGAAPQNKVLKLELDAPPKKDPGLKLLPQPSLFNGPLVPCGPKPLLVAARYLAQSCPGGWTAESATGLCLAFLPTLNQRAIRKTEKMNKITAELLPDLKPAANVLLATLQQKSSPGVEKLRLGLQQLLVGEKGAPQLGTLACSLAAVLKAVDYGEQSAILMPFLSELLCARPNLLPEAFVEEEESSSNAGGGWAQPQQQQRPGVLRSGGPAPLQQQQQRNSSNVPAPLQQPSADPFELRDLQDGMTVNLRCLGGERKNLRIAESKKVDGKGGFGKFATFTAWVLQSPGEPAGRPAVISLESHGGGGFLQLVQGKDGKPFLTGGGAGRECERCRFAAQPAASGGWEYRIRAKGSGRYLCVEKKAGNLALGGLEEERTVLRTTAEPGAYVDDAARFLLRLRQDGSYEILGKEYGGRLGFGEGSAEPTKEGSPMCLWAPGSISGDARSFRLEKLEDGSTGYRVRTVSGGALAERLEDQRLVALSLGAETKPEVPGEESKTKEEQQPSQGFDLTFIFEPVPTSAIRLLGHPLRPEGGQSEGTTSPVEVGIDPKEGEPWVTPVTGASCHPSVGFQLLSRQHPGAQAAAFAKAKAAKAAKDTKEVKDAKDATQKSVSEKELVKRQSKLLAAQAKLQAQGTKLMEKQERAQAKALALQEKLATKQQKVQEKAAKREAKHAREMEKLRAGMEKSELKGKSMEQKLRELEATRATEEEEARKQEAEEMKQLEQEAENAQREAEVVQAEAAKVAAEEAKHAADHATETAAAAEFEAAGRPDGEEGANEQREEKEESGSSSENSSSGSPDDVFSQWIELPLPLPRPSNQYQ